MACDKKAHNLDLGRHVISLSMSAGRLQVSQGLLLFITSELPLTETSPQRQRLLKRVPTAR